MAIDSSLRQLVEEINEPTEYDEGDVEVVLEEAPSEDEAIVTEAIDGSVTVDFGGDETEDISDIEHGANLAEYLSDDVLSATATELLNLIEHDASSRTDWIQGLKKGIDNLGLKIEERTEPWDGACDAVHPLLLESVVRFQAQTIGEILPPKGPVRTKIVGEVTQDKVAQSKRVEEYMNYYISSEMSEYRPETEKMLFGLALNGSAFRKIYSDDLLGRACSAYVPAQDLVVNYAAPDLRTAERITHRFKRSHNDVRKYMRTGFYRTVDLNEPVEDVSEIEDKIDGIEGKSPTLSSVKSTRRTLLESHVWWDFGEDPEGLELPYVITIDNDSQKILSIRRNWEDGDLLKERVDHFVHYEFVPGLGFYGLGYAHIVGNTSGAATSILRQLVDAGTLSNLPGGLKARGMRVKGDDDPIRPGEWRDVDVPSGKLSDNLFPMPYREPSAVLAELMNVMVNDSRRLASMADMKVADMNQEAPVGTTLAIIERAMKMQTAIQQRIHDGLRREFKILARIIKDGEPSYPYEVKQGQEIKQQDFDDRVDILPVSDPNSSTMAQKIMQYQAVTTLAQQTPGVFDVKFLNRQFIDMIGVPNADKIVPMDEEIPPADPVTENASILNLGKVKAYEHQDHDAHLRVHMQLRGDPGLQEQLQNSPSGAAISGTLDAHIREHLAFQYRRQIEEQLGAPLPPVGQPLPADVEKRLSSAVADAADQLMQKKQAEAQAAKNAEMQNDPIIQMKQQELQIKQQEQQRKAQKDQADIQLREKEMMLKHELERLRLAMEKEEGDLDRQQQREKEIMEELSKLAQMEREDVLEGARLGVEAAKAVQQKAQPKGDSE